MNSVTSPRLYRRDSSGNIRFWQIEVNGAKYRTHAGVVDGAIVTTDWTECKGKNVGKANATSDEEQARKEADALVAKRRKEKYSLSVEHIDIAKYFEPMLAQSYSKPNKKTGKAELTNYGQKVFLKDGLVFSQPKLDGMRCIVRKDGMYSRNGNPILSAPHIYAALQPILAAYPNLVLDGELYNHGLKSDFNRLISLVKKAKPTEDDLLESEKVVQYWIYDKFDSSSPKENYATRLLALNFIKSRINVNFIVITPTTKVTTNEELDDCYDRYLQDGYEGQIIRLEGPYEHKRSASLLKRKDFVDKEYEITNIVEGDGNRSGVAASVEFKDKKGNPFSACPIGNFDYCKKLLENKEKHIGQMATVRYQNLTPGDNGVPRFGKMVEIRDYE